MRFNTQRINSSIILLVLVLSIILSSLTSCSLFAKKPPSKEEISNNLSTSAYDSYNKYVVDYLKDWDLPDFNKIKFSYMEKQCVVPTFNYSSGLPDTYSHAKKTVELFLENYYDKIDLNNKTAVTDALLACYVKALGDPYSIYRPPVETDNYTSEMSGKFGGIGVIVEYDDNDESIMIDTVYPNSPAEKAGIKVGDYLYAVDGKTVSELGYDNAINNVRGEIGTKVELTLIRNGEFVTVTPIRAEVEELNVDYIIDEESKIAYIQIVSFKKNTFSQFKNAIDEVEASGAKGIIFDVRNNPGGYLTSVCDVISYLIPSGIDIVSYQYKGEDRVTLVSDYDYVDDNNKQVDHAVNLPFVVICNENTASAGEIFTAAIRDYRNDNLLRATIVGTTTYKKGIMQNTYYYPLDFSSVTLTVAYYDPPCGINYHGIGVSPDVFVENTKEADLQLETAYSEIEKLINAN